MWVAVRLSPTPPGHAVGTLRGTPMANRVWRVLTFFTIQSNILSGVTSAQLARNPARDGRAWRAVRLAALFGITVTGIVYSTVLAKTHEPHGWQETSTNNVFHYIVPIMMVLGWLLFGPRRRIQRRTVGLAILWPVAWIGYILIYGWISKWYPYPFLDAITRGYGRVIANALAVVAVLAVVLYWLGDRRLHATDSGPTAVRPDRLTPEQICQLRRNSMPVRAVAVRYLRRWWPVFVTTCSDRRSVSLARPRRSCRR